MPGIFDMVADCDRRPRYNRPCRNSQNTDPCLVTVANLGRDPRMPASMGGGDKFKVTAMLFDRMHDWDS